MVQSVDRAIDVLEVLAGATGSLPLGAVADATGLPPATVRRLLTTLSARGLAHQAEKTRRYSLGAGFTQLGAATSDPLAAWARIHPVDGSLPDLPRGLRGAVVAETAIGDVRGPEGFYHYRQYSAIDLAKARTFEQVWHLLSEGFLAAPGEDDLFDSQTRMLRGIPQAVELILPSLVQAQRDSAPLSAMRTAISMFGAVEGFRSTIRLDRSELHYQAQRISAAAPTIATAIFRIGHGLQPIAPDPDLSFAENYLYMISGHKPPAHVARAVEQYLITVIDHGLNASTFAARVVTSTGGDFAAAITAALGALSGPLHGGSPHRAIHTLEYISAADPIEPWARKAIISGDRLAGFGHRIYKERDPRAAILREIAEGLGGPLIKRAVDSEATIVSVLEELKPGRKLYANHEYYGAVLLETCGIPRELFDATFAVGRMIGWCAHVEEQAIDNRIIRPSGRYVGPPAPQPLPPLRANLTMDAEVRVGSR